MKTHFCILTICFISLTSFISNPYAENPKREMTSHKDSISTADTTSNYSFTTKGRLNSVRITRDSHAAKNENVKQAKSTIEVNGEQNSINITENGSGGTVRIRQNDNQNKININQTNEKTNNQDRH